MDEYMHNDIGETTKMKTHIKLFDTPGQDGGTGKHGLPLAQPHQNYN